MNMRIINLYNKLIKRSIILILAIFAFTPFVYAQNAEVGIRTLTSGNDTYIVNILPDSPADRAGLLPGSKIYKINNNKIKNYTTQEIAKSFFGDENSEITLTINYYGDKKDIKMERKKLDYKQNQNSQCMEYWKQFTPEYYVSNTVLKQYENYPRKIRLYIRANNYWANKQNTFINACKLLKTNDLTVIANYINQSKMLKKQPKFRDVYLPLAEQLNFYNTLTK